MGIYHIGYSTDAPPIKQGATFTLNCSLTSTSSTSTPFNLTSYQVRGKIRQRYNSTSATISFTAAKLSSTGGTLRLSLTSTQTAGLSEGGYVYDAEVYTTSASPTVYRFLEGKALVTPEVTY